MHLFNTWNKGTVSGLLGMYATYYEGFPISQRLTGIPNGKYKITAKLTSDANKKLYLTANNAQSEVTVSTTNKFVTAKMEITVTDGTLTIGATSEQETTSTTINSNTHNIWYKADDFKLTYLSTQVPLKIGNSAPYGTFCAPFDFKMPDGVAAYKVLGVGEDSELSLEIVAASGETLAAGTPVILNGSACEDTQYGESVTTSDLHSDGYLIGCYASDGTVPVGSYVLQKKSGESEAKFYKVGATTVHCTANRAYLSSSISSVKSILYMNLVGESTAISKVSSANSVFATYSASGAKIDRLQKGVNFVKMYDGSVKKILVK